MSMIDRAFKPLKNKSYFLFGPRGSGKSTFLDRNYGKDSSDIKSGKNEPALFFDLLDPELTHDLSLHPNNFKAEVLAEKNAGKIVIVDEIQKVPKLLDIVHSLIVKEKRQFILSGSSARRLKQKGVNLLAGRALNYHLYPFSASELGEDFNLEKALSRGLFPESYFASSDEESSEYLKSYCLNYLEKEIQQEQWVRKLTPFRRFLQVAGQSSGKVVNRSSIARDVGVDSATVENYFEILVDTMMGFYLPSYHRSIRKQQRAAAKFYLIDTGLQRALSQLLSLPLKKQTSYYGEIFEAFIVLEIFKRIEQKRLDWSLSYIRTRDDVEIDLIIEKPGKDLLLIEIKSTEKVLESHAKSLLSLGRDLDEKAAMYVFSNDRKSKKFEEVKAFHWEEGLREIGL